MFWRALTSPPSDLSHRLYCQPMRQLSLWQSQIGLGPQGEAEIAMLQEEVERGWQVMLPKEAALQIESWDIAPLGMVAQTSSFNKRETKATSSDIQSQRGVPGQSLNNWVDTLQLTIARFRKVFSQPIYHIMYLHQQLQPDNPIMLLTKVDCCKPAFRQIILKVTTAISKLCIHINDLLLVALRMTFGSMPRNPLQGTRDVSEVITDQHAINSVRKTDWDLTVFHSPHQNLLDSDKAAMDNDNGMVDKLRNKFGKADFFAVLNCPTDNDDDLLRFFCCVDNIFGAFNLRNVEKSAAAIHLESRVLPQG